MNQATSGPMKLYLRKASGKIFGPVAVSALAQWAEEGRIAPEDETSEDQETWRPAPSIDALELDWELELADGSYYGPLHRMAIANLVAENEVQASAMVRHRVSGETCAIENLLLPSLLAENRKLKGELMSVAATAEPYGADESAVRDLEQRILELTEMNARLAEGASLYKQKLEEESARREEHRQDLHKIMAELQRQEARRELAAGIPAPSQPAADPESAELKKQNAKLLKEMETLKKAASPQAKSGTATSRKKATKATKTTDVEPAEDTAPAPAGDGTDALRQYEEMQREIVKWKKLYQEERTGSGGRIKELEERNTALRNDENRARTQLDDTLRRLVQLERSYAMIVKAADASSEDDTSSVAGQMGVVLESYDELSRTYDTLVKQLEEKTSENNDLVETRKRVEEQSKERIQAMEEIVRREQAEADRARQQLSAIQESHFELVKSYREMNDRFIRLRQRLSEDYVEARPAAEAPPASIPRPRKKKEEIREKTKPGPKPKAKAKPKGPKIRLNR